MSQKLDELDFLSTEERTKQSEEEGADSDGSVEDEVAQSSQRLVRHLILQQNRKKKKKSGGFQSMGLSPPVFKGVMKKGYRIPTPIQRKTIPLILDGKDVVAMARTGSGKTAAFLIPLFERLRSHSAQVGARGLILSPTRELALQTMKFTKELGRFTGLRAAIILGGDRIEDQFSLLHNNPDIIIATPGRFLHLLVEMDMKLFSVEYVVFDEADRLFEMGFSEQLMEIIHKLPDQRQTLLFSATLPKMLVDFAKAGLTDPVLIRLDVDTKLSDQLHLSFLSCRSDDKSAVLLYLLRTVIPSHQSSVVFVATKHHVEYLRELLGAAGIDCSFVYSSLDQTARKISVGKFVHKKTNVLLVTDVAARGIDIPMLDNVINYNFPSKPKLFVHRVGRVARAGRTGTAYSLVAADEIPYMIDLHLFLGRDVIVAGSSDRDAMFGTVPHLLIEDEEDFILKLHSENHDLISLKQVADNGIKHYIRSRNPPAPESVRRAKELIATLSPHPIFTIGDGNSAETERHNLLSSLKSYKPSQTIFEVNATAKGEAKKVMLSKRAKYGSLVMNSREKKVSMDDSSRSSAERRRVDESTADDDDWKEFQTLDEWKKKSTKKIEPYINYRPLDHHTEQGLSVDHFDQQASNAVLDLIGDETKDIANAKKTRKWDRKRKRFVTESGKESQSKKIKTESGRLISSTYKSGLYQNWKLKNKVEGGLIGRTEESLPHSFSGNQRRGQFKPRPLSSAGGGRVKEELKSVNQILHKRQKIDFMRERKQKRQEKKRGGNGKSRGGNGKSRGGNGKSGGGNGKSRGRGTGLIKNKRQLTGKGNKKSSFKGKGNSSRGKRRK